MTVVFMGHVICRDYLKETASNFAFCKVFMSGRVGRDIYLDLNNDICPHCEHREAISYQP
jgi:hypothetical protein